MRVEVEGGGGKEGNSLCDLVPALLRPRSIVVTLSLQLQVREGTHRERAMVGGWRGGRGRPPCPLALIRVHLARGSISGLRARLQLNNLYPWRWLSTQRSIS